MSASVFKATPSRRMEMPKLRKMEFTLKVEPNPPKGFLGLPPEIRDLIYKYSLLEPPLWEKRHRPACQQCPRDCEKWEDPPWVNWKWGYVACDCGKREGLGLLRVNRQIHREAAPIFWSGNIHCFKTATGFVNDVGGNMRDEYRPLLRNISLLLVAGVEEHNEKIDLWAVLSQCTGLKTLELDVGHTRGFNYKMKPVMTELMEDMRKRQRKSKKSVRPQLRNLETLSLAKTLTYSIQTERFPPIGRRRPKLSILYVKAARPMDLSRMDNPEVLRDLVRDFETNFLVHTQHALSEKLIDTDSGRWGCTLSQRLDDTTTSLRLDLRDGKETTVQLYGAPICAQTRVRNAKDRIFAEAQLRAAGRLTPAEERARKNVEKQRDKRRAKWRDHHYDPSECPPGCSACREYKNKQNRERAEKLERVQLEREAAERELEVGLAKETRRQERKRVSRKSRPGKQQDDKTDDAEGEEEE